MSKIVNGKKPLSSKAAPVMSAEPDFFQNKLSVPAAIASEIVGQGKEYRWVDYRKYVEQGNTHNRGWSVYQNKDQVGGLMTGTNPDGIIRRGSVVLAVRPKELGDKHRAWLEEKNKKYKGFKKSKAEELRLKAKEHSVDSSIVDNTYDDEDSEETDN